jgi:ribosome-associated protein
MNAQRVHRPDRTEIIKPVTPLQISRLIEDAAADKKAREVVRLDIRQKSSIADYFVICEGDTDRQVRAIVDSIVEKAKAGGVRPLRMSGYQDGSWVVLDYASVIVHVFLPGERSYYDLESLWRAPAAASRTNGSNKTPAKPRVAATRKKLSTPTKRRNRTA